MPEAMVPRLIDKAGSISQKAVFGPTVRSGPSMVDASKSLATARG